MTDGQEGTPKLSRLPGELWTLVVEEWRARTVYGKAFFPFWLVSSTLDWIAVLSFMLLIATASVLVDALDGNSNSGRVLPEVYKDE